MKWMLGMCRKYINMYFFDFQYALYIVMGAKCDFREVCVNCDQFVLGEYKAFFGAYTNWMCMYFFKGKHAANKKMVVSSSNNQLSNAVNACYMIQLLKYLFFKLYFLLKSPWLTYWSFNSEFLLSLNHQGLNKPECWPEKGAGTSGNCR